MANESNPFLSAEEDEELGAIFDSVLNNGLPGDARPPREHVFICYSSKDKKWLERIETHLKPLVRNRSVTVWNDTHIKSGADWRKEIETALAQAKVAVLLVSAHFLASEFIVQHELPSLLEASKSSGLKILWVPVSACLVESTEISKFQAVLDPSKPLNKLHHAHVDDAWVKICKEIQRTMVA